MLRNKLRAMLSAKSNDLPYIELDYIESTGTQYIDIGIVQSTNYHLTCEFQMNGFPLFGNGFSIFGSRYSVNSNNYDFRAMYTTNHQGFRFTYGNNQINFPMYDNLRHYLEITPTEVILDETHKELPTISFNILRNIYLFACNVNNTMSFAYSGKIFNFKIDNVIDLIPVIRKSDGEVCMYDKVTKQFFTNQGTGEFSYAL